MRHSNLAVCWTKALAFTLAMAGCQSEAPDQPSRPTSVSTRSSTTAVTTFFTSVQPSASVHNSRSITFEFASNYSDARFICALNDDDPTYCSSPFSLHNLRDGRYRFRVYATSPTGGVDSLGVVHEWRVDTIAPNTSLAATPTGPDSILFVLQASEPNCDFVCTIDHGPPTPCPNPVTVAGLAPGSHTFKAQAVDEALNMDPVGSSYTFDFVAEAPISTTITSVDPQENYSNSTKREIHFTANHPQATFICSLNGSPQTSCNSPQVYSALGDGVYTFTVHAVSLHGTKDPFGASYSWTVDTQPATGNQMRANPSSTSIVITWQTNEPATSKLFWGKNSDFDREIIDDGILKTHHSVRLTGLSSNTIYTIVPAGRDRAGNPYALSPVAVRTLR